MRKPVMRGLHATSRGGIRRLWAFQTERKGLFRDVFQGHVVGNDVVVQMVIERLAGFRRRVQKKVIFEAKHEGVGQNAPMGVQEEDIDSVAGLHLLHMIGGHGVEEARAILARDSNPSATR